MDEFWSPRDDDEPVVYDRPSNAAALEGAYSPRQATFFASDLYDFPYGLVFVVTVIAVLLAHGLYLLTLSNHQLWIALLGVILTMAVAVTAVAVVLLALWKAYLEPTSLAPLFRGLLWSAVAIGFSLEAFAGLTWLSWKHDALGVGSNTSNLSLWQVEQLFLWNVVDAIPFLNIPSALAWPRPSVSSGLLVGALLVVFRIAVLVPIIGLGALAIKASQKGATKLFRDFRDDEWNVIKADQRELLDSRWDRFVMLATRGASGLVVAGIIFAAVSLSLLIRFVVTIGVESDSSWLRHWLDSPAHSSFVIPIIDHEVKPLWLLEVGDVAASVVIAVLVIIATIYLLLALALPFSIGPVIWRVAAVVVACSLVLLICQALSAVAVALVNIGFAEPTSAIAAGREYRTSMEWFGWNAAKMAPLADIPATTNWTLSNTYKDRWIGGLTVIQRCFTAIIVLVPVALLIEITVEEAKLRSLPRASLETPGTADDPGVAAP
jgi:hypothetical protein